ncbi:hypothetical protein KJ359_005220 [Pestalotiopsis sp. 9143b]|nr:hypothetical protein KJ359_005220 [Pestalotiopsis sp. 9143b]
MSSPAESPVVPIQWTNKAFFKFYEPIVLLEALNTAAMETAVSPATNEPTRTNDPVDLYHAFVYKLAHVCDNAPGGETVTSFMILRTGSAGFCFYFGSNQRSEQQLDDTKEYVGRLLQLVNDSPTKSSDSSSEHDPVLRSVLLFNQERLTGYLSRLELYARECLANPSALNLDENKFREYAKSLQNFDLDARIQQGWSKESFRPIVHAEVLLLDWLERNGGTADHRFFNDWKYIGSSKPTCKLCHYYFECHGSMIQHRPSHGNLYISWRVPDVYTTQGEHVVEARQVIVDKVLDKIRKDAFSLVEQRVPPSYKDHDSNTFSAMVTLQDMLTTDDRSTHGLDNVARLMQGMTLGNA